MLEDKIKTLTEKEEKLRNLYLRKLAKGEIQGPPTGYSSIDKPWLKYYSESAIIEDIPKKTISGYLMDKFQENKDAVCLEYYGTKITREKFLEIIRRVAVSYEMMGVKEGDIVSIIAPTTPETIYSIYALNKLGATANIVDPRLSVDNIKEKCRFSKIITSIDLAEPKIKKVVDETQKVIYFSVSESFPKPLKMAYILKNKQNKNLNTDDSIIWKDFLKLSKESTVDFNIPYKEDKVAIIVSTSGTTGPSKLAQLTNENVNAVAWQYGNSGIRHELGDVFLNIMPAFLSYGAVAGIHMPLTLGFKNVIIPQRDLNKMGHYVLKYKPQAYLDIPNGYAALKNDPKIESSYTKTFRIFGKEYKVSFTKNADLSFLRSPGVGGDHLNAQLEEVTNEFLKQHNNDQFVAKGYGMTEVSSAAVVNVSKDCNSLESVGVPFVKTVVKVVNKETKKEVRYNEEGELYISTPALFKGYLNNDDATNNETEIGEDNKKWINTGDIFTIKENGELFFHGREKAMFVRPDGHNNHPMEMNELILKHKAVKDSCTVGIESPYHAQGKYPKSVIVLKEEYKGKEEKIQKELEDMCMCELSQRDVPYFYEFRDNLPYTPGGKVDYVLLSKEGVANSKKAAIAKAELDNLDKKELVKKR